MVKHIDPAGLKALQSSCLVVDIRDDQSFNAGHIPNAIQLTNENAFEFLTNTPREQTVVVCCYHGISSINAASFLLEQGFQDVYSLDGGYEAWAMAEPS
ncbi:thiosulfate sulfurtransferase GlpE [Gynuella sp.]|uniref:thiosulfate sulfurtransferase GlpE n=1 Tax=Gynuella sp. TaxID=2969146 RepID=UPI003D0DF514